MWPSLSCLGLALVIAVVIARGDPGLAVAAVMWTILIVGIWTGAVISDRPRNHRPVVRAADYVIGSRAAAVVAAAPVLEARHALAVMRRARTREAFLAAAEGLPRVAPPWPLHRLRLPWHDTAPPRQRHACWPQTVGVLAGSGRRFERCPCGAIRQQRWLAPWEQRNEQLGVPMPRRHRAPGTPQVVTVPTSLPALGAALLALPPLDGRPLTERRVRMLVSSLILSVPIVCLSASGTAEPVRDLIPRIGSAITHALKDGGGAPGGGVSGGSSGVVTLVAAGTHPGPSAPAAAAAAQPSGAGAGAGSVGSPATGRSAADAPAPRSGSRGGTSGVSATETVTAPSSAASGGSSARPVGAVPSAPASVPTTAPTGAPASAPTPSTGGPSKQGVIPPAVGSAVAPVTSAVGPVVAPVTSAVGPVVAPVTSAVGPVAGPVVSAVAQVVTAVSSAAAPAASVVGPVISNVAAPVSTAVAPVVSAAGSAAAPVASAVGSAAAPVVSGVAAPVDSAAAPVVSQVAAPVSDVGAPVGPAVGSVLGSVTGARSGGKGGGH
jgi:hypothetical protein